MLPAPAHTGRGRCPSDTSYRVAKRASICTLARGPYPQVPQWHPRVAKRASIGTLAQEPYPQVPQGHPRVAKGDFWPVFGTATIPTGASESSPRGKGRLLAGLRHSDPTHRYLSGILAWRRGLLSALWHGDPFHRYLSGILAWRSILLTGLRHGDHQLKHFCGRVACRRKGNRYR